MINRIILVYDSDEFKFLKELKEHSGLKWEEYILGIAHFAKEKLDKKSIIWEKGRLEKYGIKKKEETNSGI